MIKYDFNYIKDVSKSSYSLYVMDKDRFEEEINDLFEKYVEDFDSRLLEINEVRYSYNGYQMEVYYDKLLVNGFVKIAIERRCLYYVMVHIDEAKENAINEIPDYSDYDILYR